MSVIVWLLDGLADLTAPYWLTLQALGNMIADAGAGTALVGSFLLLVSLDFLRGSKGLFTPVARVLSIGFTLFVLASFVYGDFLAAPAKAAYSAIVARSEAVVAPNVVVLTTLGAAGAGAFFMTSWRPAPRAISPKAPSTRVFASMRRATPLATPTRAPSIDAAERLQLRQMTHNPKKAVNAVRSAVRAMAAVQSIPRHGQRTSRLGRV